jgi:hypothetical protein
MAYVGNIIAAAGNRQNIIGCSWEPQAIGHMPLYRLKNL